MSIKFVSYKILSQLKSLLISFLHCFNCFLRHPSDPFRQHQLNAKNEYNLYFEHTVINAPEIVLSTIFPKKVILKSLLVYKK